MKVLHLWVTDLPFRCHRGVSAYWTQTASPSCRGAIYLVCLPLCQWSTNNNGELLCSYGRQTHTAIEKMNLFRSYIWPQFGSMALGTWEPFLASQDITVWNLWESWEWWTDFGGQQLAFINSLRIFKVPNGFPYVCMYENNTQYTATTHKCLTWIYTGCQTS